MKILILNKMYHPDIGGVETVTKQYAEWLSSENHKVTVLTTRSKSNFKIETKMINNVKVRTNIRRLPETPADATPLGKKSTAVPTTKIKIGRGRANDWISD